MILQSALARGAGAWADRSGEPGVQDLKARVEPAEPEELDPEPGNQEDTPGLGGPSQPEEPPVDPDDPLPAIWLGRRSRSLGRPDPGNQAQRTLKTG